jgi:hypothetical protein
MGTPRALRYLQTEESEGSHWGADLHILRVATGTLDWLNFTVHDEIGRSTFKR